MGWCRKITSDWVRDMTKSQGESLCVCVGGGGGGGDLEAIYTFSFQLRCVLRHQIFDNICLMFCRAEYE